MQDRPVYVLLGEKVTSLESFFTVIGEVINGPGGYFGSNLDAFADCLRGGMGTPPPPYLLYWRNSEKSRIALGYPETVMQLKLRLMRCHPDNRKSIAADLASAELGKGSTVFDELVAIIREENIELELA